MKPTWSIVFWYQIRLQANLPSGKGIIASYGGITIFLTVDDHVIGINDGEHDYLGPTITGLEKDPWIFYYLIKDVSTISLYLNAIKVIEISEFKTAYKIDQFHAQAGDSSRIQVIEQDLSNWIIKRKSMFKLQRKTSRKYRLLSKTEQEAQLYDRVQALGNMIQDFNAGKTYCFEDILTTLRALVFYKITSKTYDPLLLRIAALNEISLPVYVIPLENESVNHVLSIGNVLGISALGLAAFEPGIPNTKMTDFQDFLEKPALIYNDEFISPLELIETAASTRAAHFDQRSPLVLDALEDTPVFSGQNMLKQHILSLAELVVKLGYYVLSLGKRSSMIRIIYPLEIQEMFEFMSVDSDLIRQTVNDRHRGFLIMGNPPTVGAIHWFDENPLFVMGAITKTHQEGNNIKLDEVTVSLVLKLRNKLPAGEISKDLDFIKILKIIAESFGLSVRCFKGQEPSFLHVDSEWDGELRVAVEPKKAFLLQGTFIPEKKRCNFVWAFSLDRYKEWFNSKFDSR